eukprot:scaffold48758_cov61-Phaeocystis_antarctica.AAC.8
MRHRRFFASPHSSLHSLARSHSTLHTLVTLPLLPTEVGRLGGSESDPRIERGCERNTTCQRCHRFTSLYCLHLRRGRPFPSSTSPRFFMAVSVSGCRSPSVSRIPSSASRSSGSAAARSPLAFNTRPRLPMEMSVLGCRSPSVSRNPSSASLDSGSAAAKLPLAFNSKPRLLMEPSVSGCRLPSVSRDTSSASCSSGSAAARSSV